MQAAALDRPKHLQVRAIARPLLQPNHVLLKVRACGVCRTDLHIVEGELPALRPNIIPGHQIVGDIVDGATSDLPLGTRVGVSWIGGTTALAPIAVAVKKISATPPPSPATPLTAATLNTPWPATISFSHCRQT